MSAHLAAAWGYYDPVQNAFDAEAAAAAGIPASLVPGRVARCVQQVPDISKDIKVPIQLTKSCLRVLIRDAFLERTRDRPKQVSAEMFCRIVPPNILPKRIIIALFIAYQVFSVKCFVALN